MHDRLDFQQIFIVRWIPPSFSWKVLTGGRADTVLVSAASASTWLRQLHWFHQLHQQQHQHHVLRDGNRGP